MNRTVALLSLCQALRMTVVSLLVATSPLVGLALAPMDALATVPFGLVFVGNLLSAIPASMYMKLVGRQFGLVTGAMIGAVGAALSAYAILWGSFPAFCVGALLLGVFSAFGQFYRFAAIEAAAPEAK